MSGGRDREMRLIVKKKRLFGDRVQRGLVLEIQSE